MPCVREMVLKGKQNHAGMDRSDIAIVSISETEAYFCASQNPSALSHDWLKGLQ